ncbi:unnamed protein product [Acanthoscelides obtectus]|uniref:Tc1-like transposase DDE domain-containing protein n=1 Tax=Acanthoscelides obtectus TaxID=200917 RepID=A0A9P0LZR0_ACAOB|nr:unnamed protein product [Acanthoscelides obtectus]CAK1623180.1 Transposable element Tc3 transposase [Acanthoscelides obtectus]
MFSHEEKCDMLECYLQENKYYSELYPARIQPYERYFLRLYRRFRGNENVFAKTRAKKEFIISEATEIAVIGYFEAYRENSIADILKDSNFSYGTVQRILKKYKFIPYKYRPVQTLLAGDPERRLVFCHWYLSFCRQNVNNFRYLLWTDESNFSNSGMFNRKNHHYWSRENLLLVHPRGPQVRFSFNVWCGIIGSKIVGPFFYEGTLTGERYVEFMSEILTNFLDELDLISRHHLHFQQDGAPAHNSRGTYHFLSTTFNDQWIGTNGPIPWPPRSPDLNPLDYFLWGYLKNQIYKRRYDNLDALKTAVREKITQIDGRTILKTVRAVEKPAQKCIEEQGGSDKPISADEGLSDQWIDDSSLTDSLGTLSSMMPSRNVPTRQTRLTVASDPSQAKPREAFLRSTNLRHDRQYGFRHQRSTGDLLAYSYGEARVVALDITKALDQLISVVIDWFSSSFHNVNADDSTLQAVIQRDKPISAAELAQIRPSLEYCPHVWGAAARLHYLCFMATRLTLASHPNRVELRTSRTGRYNRSFVPRKFFQFY